MLLVSGGHTINSILPHRTPSLQDRFHDPGTIIARLTSLHVACLWLTHHQLSILALRTHSVQDRFNDPETINVRLTSPHFACLWWTHHQLYSTPQNSLCSGSFSRPKKNHCKANWSTLCLSLVDKTSTLFCPTELPLPRIVFMTQKQSIQG